MRGGRRAPRRRVVLTVLPSADRTAPMAQASAALRTAPPETSPIRFGTILFLASELLFFGGLFAAYFTLRSETDPWPPGGVELDAKLSTLATGLLLLSSFTFIAGVRAAREGRLPALKRW